MNYVRLIKDCDSFSDFCKMLNLPINGSGIRKAKEIIKEQKLNISHFDGGRKKRIKYERIKKECPVCNKKFETKKGSRYEKRTCSIACSNTFFRSGDKNGNWKKITEFGSRTRTFSKKYRKICFENHEHKCVICGENKLLDVHHFDKDIFNNDPENLIPICATHHNYLHSKYKSEIIDKVIKYRDEFIDKRGA